MSTTATIKKRKLETSSRTKGSRPPHKKARRQAYHSDSEDDDPEVTARDAPRPSGESTAITSTKIETTEISRRNVSDGKRTKDSKTQREASRDENSEIERDGVGDEDNEETPESGRTTESDTSEDIADGSDDSQIGSSARSRPKRHDPSAFATSISAILGSSLSRNKRVDPVLSRSKDAAEVSKALADSKLDAKARKQLVAERRLAKEKGRVRDVLIGDRKSTIEDGYENSAQPEGMSAAEILAKEKQLRKLAQRGVVKLFNAVRAAQVRGEEAARKAKADGVIGMDSREDKVKNMSRNAFLDLVGAGGERR